MATPSNDSNPGARCRRRRSARRMRDTACETVDRLSTTASDTVDRLSASAQDTLDRVADNASEYAQRGRPFVDDAQDWIAAYPWRALGIAAATGYIVARILR